MKKVPFIALAHASVDGLFEPAARWSLALRLEPTKSLYSPVKKKNIMKSSLAETTA